MIKAKILYYVQHGNKDKVKLELESGADVNTKNAVGNNLLRLAAIKGNLEIFKVLLKYKPDVQNIREHGVSILSQVASNERNFDKNINLEMIKLLLESGADVNSRSKDGWTAISRAAGRGNIETMKILIQAGADINVKDKNDGTPLGSAIVNRQLKSVRILLDAGAKINKTEIDFLFKFLDPNDNIVTNIKNLVLKL